MASITPRASGFWSDSVRTSYFPADDEDGDEDLEQQPMIGDDNYDAMAEHDGRTALDKTIDRIGMGTCSAVVGLRRTWY